MCTDTAPTETNTVSINITTIQQQYNNNTTVLLLQCQLNVGDEPCEPHIDLVGILEFLSLVLRIIGMPSPGSHYFVSLYPRIISWLLFIFLCNLNTRNNQLEILHRSGSSSPPKLERVHFKVVSQRRKNYLALIDCLMSE